MAAGALVLAGCSSTASSSVTLPPSPSGGGGTTLALTAKDFAFSPTELSVAKAGTVTVVVTNDGPAVHSFTLDDGSVSQDVQPGTSETVTLQLSGPVSFHCHFHPTQMTGTISVAGANVEPTAASPTGTTPRY